LTRNLRERVEAFTAGRFDTFLRITAFLAEPRKGCAGALTSNFHERDDTFALFLTITSDLAFLILGRNMRADTTGGGIGDSDFGFSVPSLGFFDMALLIEYL
jgi:hypothetical protein